MGLAAQADRFVSDSFTHLRGSHVDHVEELGRWKWIGEDKEACTWAGRPRSVMIEADRLRQPKRTLEVVELALARGPGGSVDGAGSGALPSPAMASERVQERGPRPGEGAR